MPWINCYLIQAKLLSKEFLQMTCPYCRKIVFAPPNSHLDYDYCPYCGKYVGLVYRSNENAKVKKETEA